MLFRALHHALFTLQRLKVRSVEQPSDACHELTELTPKTVLEIERKLCGQHKRMTLVRAFSMFASSLSSRTKVYRYATDTDTTAFASMHIFWLIQSQLFHDCLNSIHLCSPPLSL